jgi:hypothetical protein
MSDNAKASKVTLLALFSLLDALQKRFDVPHRCTMLLPGSFPFVAKIWLSGRKIGANAPWFCNRLSPPPLAPCPLPSVPASVSGRL